MIFVFKGVSFVRFGVFVFYSIVLILFVVLILMKLRYLYEGICMDVFFVLMCFFCNDGFGDVV